MKINKIGIIGLGLIGGSIAKALRRNNPQILLYIIDIDETALSTALNEGIADFITTDDYSIMNNCQVIFLCAPVKASISYLENIAPYVNNNTIVTDVCSTKAEIIYTASKYENLTFVGGHPMAGSEKSGYIASTPHLFENAYYVLCPGVNCKEASYDLLSDLVLSFGAIPIKMTPEHHDFVTGSISHLPHVLAASLVNFVIINDTEDNGMKTLAAGGFKDITRIASSSPTMWQNICLSNKEPILSILEKFIEMLSEFKVGLTHEDSSYIHDFFNKAKTLRDSMVVNKNSIIPLYYELIADIPDKPGVLGEIATLLGKENINIKNMNISNSRELEGGCLTVSFPDAISRDSAILILSNSGIHCYAK